MIYWIAYVLVSLLSKICFSFRIRGLGHIPPRGSFILASNHISNLDPFVIGLAFHRRISYLAKDSLFKNEVLAFFLYHVGAFPIKRDSSDIKALKEILKRLKFGCPVVIFPEGTRIPMKKVREVLPGIGFVAVKSGVPVIPVFIEGTDNVLAPGARGFRYGPIQLSFGKALTFSKGDSYPEIARGIMQSIQDLAFM